MKKQYVSPAMTVVELNSTAALLAGSADIYGGPLGARPVNPMIFDFQELLDLQQTVTSNPQMLLELDD